MKETTIAALGPRRYADNFWALTTGELDVLGNIGITRTSA
jgi:hypothetical protein